MQRISWILFLTALMALLLAGCPGKEQGSSTGGDESATVSGQTAADSGTGQSADSMPAAGQSTPNAAADVSFSTFDKTAHKLSDYRGKPVVLNFWADW